jgi:hypothetical protein
MGGQKIERSFYFDPKTENPGGFRANPAGFV